MNPYSFLLSYLRQEMFCEQECVVRQVPESPV